jgi:D-aminoacyl-tRNA deacylase
VEVDGEVVGEVGPGLCVFVAVTHSDTGATAAKLADRLWGLRIFDDEGGFMNRPLSQAGGEILVVSQFTLYGDTRRGRRPSWSAAAPPEQAEVLVDRLVGDLRSMGATVATGRFRAHMQVSLLNDGPVTLSLEVGEGAPRVKTDV